MGDEVTSPDPEYAFVSSEASYCAIYVTGNNWQHFVFITLGMSNAEGFECLTDREKSFRC
jgi:hypothetical protein